MLKNLRTKRAECRKDDWRQWMPCSISISRSRQSSRWWRILNSCLQLALHIWSARTRTHVQSLFKSDWLLQISNDQTSSATHLVTWNGLSVSAQTGNCSCILLGDSRKLPPSKYLVGSKFQLKSTIKFLSEASCCGRDTEVQEKQASVTTFCMYESYCATCFGSYTEPSSVKKILD
jgi:hypothetical protein